MERRLAVLDSELPSKSLTETFYTGAYRGLVAPAIFNDVDQTYRGQDHKNHSNPGFNKYTTLSIWDIYRGEFPFIMLMQPHRSSDIVRTLLADHDQLGLHMLPMWPLWGNETWSMTGFHAAGMILGAYVRGFRDFDAEAAYTAIRETALAPRTTAPAGTSARDAERWQGNGALQESFRKFGYVPTDLHGGSVSCTLDLAYDYWCAGAMAEMLGKHDDSAMFCKLGENYRNVFDSSTGFMRPKKQDGKWFDPFRPDIQYADYVETDAWQASFSVPHDVQGLIDLHGGDAAFIAKLDGLFTAPSYVAGPPWPQPDISGMVGQDAQGNEPSNHNPYLFPFAGAAWKTQYCARHASTTNTPAGIPGNDALRTIGQLVRSSRRSAFTRLTAAVRRLRYRQPDCEPRKHPQSRIRTDLHHRGREQLARQYIYPKCAAQRQGVFAPALRTVDQSRRRPSFPHGEQAKQGVGIGQGRPAAFRPREGLTAIVVRGCVPELSFCGTVGRPIPPPFRAVL